MEIWLHIVIVMLAVARATRLFTTDRITVGLRVRVVAKFGEDSMAAYWLGCRWCLSIWVGAPMVALYTVWPNRWTMGVFVWLAISYMVGLLSQLERE